MSVCYKRIAGTDTLCAPVSLRHRRLSPGHLDGRHGEVGHRYGILLLATGSVTAGPERSAVRQQAIPAVGQRCRHLCENGTAAAKIFAL